MVSAPRTERLRSLPSRFCFWRLCPMDLPHDEVVPILDFGSQTAQLIARRCRELGVYAVLIDPKTPAAEIAAMEPPGIILSGGPASVYDEGAPSMDPQTLRLGIPVLGICYGMQLACRLLGADVSKAGRREFGRASVTVSDRSDLLSAIPERTTVWMSHGDQIESIGQAGLRTLASTPTCPHAAVGPKQGDEAPGGGAPQFWGLQFHPEVTHTPHGVDILQNFLFEVCKARGGWRMSAFAETAAER